MSPKWTSHRDERWFLIRDELPPYAAYFQGFDRRTNRSLGYLGTAGFGPDLPPREQRFPADDSYEFRPPALRLRTGKEHATAFYFVSDADAFEVSCDQRSVRRLDLGGAKILGIAYDASGSPDTRWIAIRTDRAIHFFYDDGTDAHLAVRGRP